MKITSLARRRQRGFSLVEIAVVLGVVGIILGAIWVAAVSVSKKETVNQATQELQTIEQNMVTLYQNRSFPSACGGGTDMTDAAVKADIIPSQFTYPSLAPCTKAGQPWHISAGGLTINTVSATSYSISFSDIPVDGCAALLLEATSCDPIQAGCPIAIAKVGSSSNISPNAGPPKNWQNITPPQAETYCKSNSAYTGGKTIVGTNVLTFEYAN
jgi:prepilin-type N-terminal cleavage/methylation domain-containing protein